MMGAARFFLSTGVGGMEVRAHLLVSLVFRRSRTLVERFVPRSFSGRALRLVDLRFTARSYFVAELVGSLAPGRNARSIRRLRPGSGGVFGTSWRVCRIPVP